MSCIVGTFGPGSTEGEVHMSSDNIKTFRCMCCGSRAAAPWLLDCSDYFHGTPTRVSYFACIDCGLVQQSPLPDNTSIFYENYLVHADKSAFYGSIRRLIMKPAYYDVRKTSKSATLIDYGCGDGAYLRWIAANHLNRVGFEPDIAHAHRLSQLLGIPMYSDSRKLVRDFFSTVDVVTLHMVLEHVTNIAEVFQTAHALLRVGGICYITVPHIRSWEARFFRKRWHGLDPPRHISFPEPAVIERFAVAAGFQLQRHHAISFPPGIAGSISTAMLGRFSQRWFNVAIPLAVALSRVFPTGFRAYWLVKK